MPDLISHIAFSHITTRIFEFKSKSRFGIQSRILIYLGTILPDLLTRPIYIIFPETSDWIIPFHTPIGSLITCGLISLLFIPSFRLKAFFLISFGTVLHFFLDSFQRHLTGGNLFLFPFSWKRVEFGLVWSDQTILFIPLWLLLVIAVETIFFAIKKSRSNRDKLL